ncbi:hypothetical protein K437DRAFT_269004 [Tilletiaria anomala UBC 951]|uniref:Uncharacterized protein n=1 Tax=Tilletiaria anomala (strain ATCC 24038 / CBS 436.72 / UBC 951) TaxID=1037660 RepID=A0A066VU11_TILAU|nr:uncharacterized protein K437DRAFT_269004 [Tilletiaria anomala UBC 951]KDN43758.1 hypothetical protein K437DRAFT_269004 [Tilletiaria anomala UBC 951]
MGVKPPPLKCVTPYWSRHQSETFEQQTCEPPVVRLAGELGLPYTLSTADSGGVGRRDVLGTQGSVYVMKNGLGAQHSQGLRVFQLYFQHDKELATSLLQRTHDDVDVDVGRVSFVLIRLSHYMNYLPKLEGKRHAVNRLAL